MELDDAPVVNLPFDALPVSVLATVSNFLHAAEVIKVGSTSRSLRMSGLWTYKLQGLPSIFSKLPVSEHTFAAVARSYLAQARAVCGQPARDIGAAWLDTPHYWGKNVPTRESPFGHVHQLKSVWWLDISGCYELPIIQHQMLSRLPPGQALHLTCVLRVKVQGYVGRLKRSVDAVDVPDWMDLQYTLPCGVSSLLPAPVPADSGGDVPLGQPWHPAEPARRGVGQGVPADAPGVDPGVDPVDIPRDTWSWIHLGTMSLRVREGAVASGTGGVGGDTGRIKLRWRLWDTDGAHKSGMLLDHMRVLAVHGPLRGVSGPDDSAVLHVDQATPVLGLGYTGRDASVCSQEIGAQPYMPVDGRELWKLQLSSIIAAAPAPPPAAATSVAQATQARERPRIRAGRLHPRLQQARQGQDGDMMAEGPREAVANNTSAAAREDGGAREAEEQGVQGREDTLPEGQARGGPAGGATAEGEEAARPAQQGEESNCTLM